MSVGKDPGDGHQGEVRNCVWQGSPLPRIIFTTNLGSSSLQTEAVEQQLVVKSNQLNTVLQVHKQNPIPAAGEATEGR